jgi:methylthioribose-1-phosphate isomerase
VISRKEVEGSPALGVTASVLACIRQKRSDGENACLSLVGEKRRLKQLSSSAHELSTSGSAKKNCQLDQKITQKEKPRISC